MTASASTDTTESVERVISAPAEAIFDILAAPARHREIDGSGTVRDAQSAPTRVGLGDTFGMDMKMGFGYRMVNTIIEFEEARRIAWQTHPDNKIFAKFIGGRIWRYELTPVEGGTLVRETWDISQERHPRSVRPLRRRTTEAMAATLERIAAVVE